MYCVPHAVTYVPGNIDFDKPGGLVRSISLSTPSAFASDRARFDGSTSSREVLNVNEFNDEAISR